MTSKRCFDDLSSVEIVELCKRYDEGVKIKDIISEFNIDVNPSGLSKLLPLKQIDEKCIYCNVPLEIKRTRNSYTYDNDPKCPKCNHIKYMGWTYKKCNCDNCIAEEYKKLKSIRDEIEKAFPKPSNKIEEEDVDIVNLSKLLFLMYTMGEESDLNTISYDNLSYYIDESILEYFIDSLIKKELVYIDVLKSPIDTFDLKSLPPKYKFEEASFKINVNFSEDTITRLSHNDYSIKSYTEELRLDALLYFMMISLTLNLENLMIERGFNDITVEGIKLRKLLNKVSYNNVRYLEYKQAEYALHLKYVDHVPDSKICKNITTMVYNCCNRYLAEGWEFYSPSLEYVDDFIRIFVECIMDEDINILNENISQIFV